MCGIAGIVGKFDDKALVPSMLEIMNHRGPDCQGFYLSEKVHLGHTRLSIIDLSKQATQPFISKEHNVAIAVNGEIYNFGDIKQNLQGKGYVFQSDSDSEIVLHAYIEHGLDFVPELNGMFAISIWDGNKRELFLIRDRLGIKPLYYTKTINAFLFASEIKALAQYDELDLSIDMQSFAEYLAFENYFSNRTLNKNIKLVEPGEIVKYGPSDRVIDRKYFWQPALGVTGDSYDGGIYDKYIDVIESSVNRHLISDVPVGSYLSAGIDSSSVAYWSSKKYGNSLKTFTGSFGMTGFYDEATAAAEISKHYGCDNYNIEIRPEDFEKNIEKILWHLDEPKVGMGAFSQYMVAERAAREVKVILTGHGGDEFFAGYPVFKAIYGKKNIPKLILRSSFRELMFAAYFSLYPKIRQEAGYFLPNIYSLKSLKHLLSSDFYNNLIRHSNIFKEPESLKEDCNDEYERLTLTYLKYYLPSLFIVEDKISMAFSLESRTPLCDNEMLDFALSVPLSVKLSGYELKHVPRWAMRGKLPDFIYNLPKRGFPTPLRLWFKRELKEYIKNYIFDNIDAVNVLKRDEVERILTSYQNSKISTPFDEINAHKIWIVLNLIIYFKNQRQRYKIKVSR
jgi:asparagine synthase (glutamine-hydrolysing)